MGKENKNNSVQNPHIRYEGDTVYVVPEPARDYFITYYNTPGGIWRSFNRDIDGAVEEANNNYKHRAQGDLGYEPLNIAPEVTITGYRPIRLKTFYPLHKGYPITGHSTLKIPITSKVVQEYTGEERPMELAVDKQSSAKDYNLVTNNCADTTLKYLNYIFGTNERTNFFTTPGDVRDFAINKLKGKVITDKDGNDTVIIPRTKENADKLSEKALQLYEKEPDLKTVKLHHLKQGGKVRRMQTAAGGPLYPWTPTTVNPAVKEWASKENIDWRFTPASRSKVAGGATKSTAVKRKPESSEDYTKRRIKEETKRTWRSDVADILHGIGEGALSLHPYTAIPYYGAKTAQDLFNGNYGWWTALNAAVPLFHLSPQITRAGNVTKEFIKDAATTAKSYVSHPTYQTVYHGSPVEFNVSEARMGTPYDMGLHVGDKTVADIMRDHRGIVYKLRIPKEQAVTSDLSRNGINHIKTDYKIVNERAGYGELGNWDDYKNIGKTTGVDWNIDDDVLMNALRSQGVEGKNYVLDATGYHTKNWPSFRYLRTDENTAIHINPREQLTKNLSEEQRASFNQEADKLLAEYNAAPHTREQDIIYNTKTANLLHKYGINVVKYWNRNPIETLNPSWFVTDPSVIDVMPNMSLSKYRSIWGNYQPGFNLQNSSEVYPLGLSATINNYNIRNKEK